MAEGLHIEAICQDITESLPLEDNSIDIVIDIFCYKHQVNDEKRSFYREEINRIMKDNGYLLLSLAGKDDGYYGELLSTSNSFNKIVDPETGVGSILFDPDDIEAEFSPLMFLKKTRTVRKNGMMHGREYLRLTHAFIMQKDLPEIHTDDMDVALKGAGITS